MFAPNKYPAPLGLNTHPLISVLIKKYHQDQTTLGRTLIRRVEFIAFCRLSGSALQNYYLVNGIVNCWTESPMNAENAIIDNCC
jgi:hypothetical protein